MAGASISHLVLFIASLLIAGTVVGAAFTGVDQFNDAMEDRSISAAEQLRTDIAIISDPASNAIYDGENVTVLLKNVGETNLAADVRQVDVLLNGQYVAQADINATVVDGEPGRWQTRDVLRLTIATDGLTDGDHRVSVSVNGVQEALNFRVNT